MRKKENVKELCEEIFEEKERGKFEVIGLTSDEIIKSFTKKEKEMYDWLLSEDVPTDEVRGKIMITLGQSRFKSNDETFKDLKEISFADARRDIAFYGLQFMEKYNYKVDDFCELTSEAYLGMEKAWKNYMNYDSDYVQKKLLEGKKICSSFRTYAQYYIQDAIRMFIKKEKNSRFSLDLNDTALRQKNEIQSIIFKTYSKIGSLPTLEQVMKATKYDKTVVERFYNRTINTLDSNGELIKISLEEIDEIKNVEETDEKDHVNEAIKEKSKDELWEDVKKNLRPIEFKIVKMRCFEDKTFREIAPELGLTPERVRQLFKQALSKLKEAGLLEKYNFFLS